jgi:HTH-type transcriptional regulator/antitoxin HigA
VFIKALYEIRRLTTCDADAFVPRVTELCREAGIALVFLPELPATRTYGATRWLTPTKAILQLSLRGKSDDFFWFTFFHETAHILKHGKRDIFIEDSEGVHDQETLRKEQEANNFASDFLIPKRVMSEFCHQKRLTTQMVEQFASQLGIAPGIVVGRLQHDGLLPYTHFNMLKRRYRFRNE